MIRRALSRITPAMMFLLVCSIALALDYYPIKLGMRWRYEVQEEGKIYVQIVSIPRKDKMNGKVVFIQEVRKAEDGSKIAEKSWLLSDKDGVKLIRTSSYEEAISTVTPRKPITLAKRPLKVGTKWNENTTGKVKITGLIPQVGRYTIEIDVLWTSSVKADKTEMIPDARGNRTYNCIRLVEETKLTVQGMRIDVPDENVRDFILQNNPMKKGNVLRYLTVAWLAPNVGPVKTEETFLVPGQPPRKRVKRLLDFKGK
jgi:hypothetical protein